jgi:hypothetical protein
MLLSPALQQAIATFNLSQAQQLIAQEFPCTNQDDRGLAGQFVVLALNQVAKMCWDSAPALVGDDIKQALVSNNVSLLKTLFTAHMQEQPNAPLKSAYAAGAALTIQNYNLGPHAPNVEQVRQTNLLIKQLGLSQAIMEFQEEVISPLYDSITTCPPTTQKTDRLSPALQQAIAQLDLPTMQRLFDQEFPCQLKDMDTFAEAYTQAVVTAAKNVGKQPKNYLPTEELPQALAHCQQK